MRFSDIAHTCAQNLLRRKSRTILTVLGVIVGTGYGYVRPDGIAVIPIGALAP